MHKTRIYQNVIYLLFVLLLAISPYYEAQQVSLERGLPELSQSTEEMLCSEQKGQTSAPYTIEELSQTAHIENHLRAFYGREKRVLKSSVRGAILNILMPTPKMGGTREWRNQFSTSNTVKYGTIINYIHHKDGYI